MENLHLNVPHATHIQEVYHIHFLLYDKVCSPSFSRWFCLILPSSVFELFRVVSRVFSACCVDEARLKQHADSEAVVYGGSSGSLLTADIHLAL